MSGAVAIRPPQGYNSDMAALADLLSARTREADPALYDTYNGTWVRCYACGHACHSRVSAFNEIFNKEREDGTEQPCRAHEDCV